MKNAARCLVATALITCSFVPLVTVAATLQPVLPTPSTAKATVLDNNPILARNTTSKSDASTVTVAAKGQQVKDKKAIGRCWQRLMTMMREVRSAHQTSKSTK